MWRTNYYCIMACQFVRIKPICGSCKGQHACGAHLAVTCRAMARSLVSHLEYHILNKASHWLWWSLKQELKANPQKFLLCRRTLSNDFNCMLDMSMSYSFCRSRINSIKQIQQTIKSDWWGLYFRTVLMFKWWLSFQFFNISCMKH